MDLEKIALFPIPELVSFPKTSVPLHVFEPRYRSMIKDCVRSRIKIGVCHVEDIISQAPKNQDPANVLNSNQSTFKPKDVFSAGLCTIDDVTADGRFKVHIDMDSRYKIISVDQELPYVICMCERYEDTESEEQTDYTSTLRHKIDSFLIDYATKAKDQFFISYLNSDDWKSLSDTDYSFKIFEKIKLQGNLAQEALEKKTPYQRLKVLEETLKLNEGLS
jgi:Lon protease-like protein